MTNQVLFAFLLTLLAGLSTGIGSSIAFFTGKANVRLLSFGLGFSGGVMVYVSLVEILAKATDTIAEVHGPGIAGWIAAGSFFAGIGVIALIDRLVPEQENPHAIRSDTDLDRVATEKTIIDPSLERTGLITALAIAIHNFPEGLVTFLGALVNPFLGVSLAVAIAVHNIPEGISVSVPFFYATGNRRRAFLLSFLSGCAEPAGALVGYFVLRAFLSNVTIGALFAAVAGIMVFISFDELIPTARKYGKGHTAIAGIVTGMAVMAISLCLLP